jgi:hypothetical protein
MSDTCEPDDPTPAAGGRPPVDAIEAALRRDNYAEHKIEPVGVDLAHVDPSLHEALAAWIDDQQIPEVTVGARSLAGFTDEGYTVPAAILTLDWLIREPDAADSAIRRGHDHVGPGPSGTTSGA